MKISQWVLKMQDQASAGLSKVSGAADKVSAKFEAAHAKINSFDNKAKSTAATLGNWLVAGGVIAGLGALTGKIFNVTAETQKYNAVLTNSLGSQKQAADAMKMLSDFAKSTPYDLQSITGAFTQMVNRGLMPTKAQLVSMGDIAAASGKDLNQLTEALLDAQTGEFERLKEFGVKAKVEGDKVSFMFKGQATTIANTSDAISNYIFGLGNVTGVQGNMAAQMGTLGGRLSNLQDNFVQLLIVIGDKLVPVFGWFLDAINLIISDLPMLKDMISAVAVTLGVLAAAYGIVNFWTIVATAQMWLLNAALLANPIVIVVVAITGLVLWLVYLWNTSEKVRGSLIGLWEGAKQVFANIANAAKMYLGGVADLLVGIFTLNPEKIKAGLAGLTGAMKAATVDLGKGVAEKFEMGYAQGAKGVQDRLAPKKAKEKNSYEDAALAAQSAQSKLSKSKAGTTKKGIDGVAGGGKETRNVTVTIGALMKDITYHLSGSTEAAKQTGQLTMDALIRAIQGAENATY